MTHEQTSAKVERQAILLQLSELDNHELELHQELGDGLISRRDADQVFRYFANVRLTLEKQLRQ
jgi:hypothetical protein